MKRSAFLCIVFSCLALSALITGCGQTQSIGETYENEKFGFSCQYPTDWELQAHPAGTLVLFAGPMDADGEFRINISVFIEELLGYPGISLDEYTEISEIQFQESLDDYQRLALSDTTISEMTAKLITYSFGIENLKIKGAQAFFIRNNIAYIITYSATLETYSEYYTEFELVFMSFNLD
ncbi:MAG: hypothetical protein JXA17_00540 [Dehalococcoidales bacterium]|nr:hypothetical protein [Dehalococcoidales bacterium]